MTVIAIRKRREPEPSAEPAKPARKTLAATQKALDEIPLDSGTWQVEGQAGLYLRSRAKTKSFYLQRRVAGKLTMKTIGETSMKNARELASIEWAKLRAPKRIAAPSVQVTFAQAFERYMEQATLADATIKNYRIVFTTYLKEWHNRPVSDIGRKREDLRALHQRIRKDHRDAIANQARRLLSAVYNYHRDGSDDETLPAFPKKAAPLYTLAARDWAYSDDELRTWWHATVRTKKKGDVERGVKTLNDLKRAYWLTSLLTGARPRSIENLKWTDIDFEKRAIRFRVTKENRPYTVPMADVLHRILEAFRASDAVPPSEDDWVFPSERNPFGHLTDVKDEKSGVGAKYHLRHTFKTRLTALGFTNEMGKMLMGHALTGDVAHGYISAPALVESLRPVVNALTEHYCAIMPGIAQ